MRPLLYSLAFFASSFATPTATHPRGIMPVLRARLWLSAKEVYRLSIVGDVSTASRRADLILDQGVDGLTGYLLTDAYYAVLENAKLEDGTVRATVLTPAGRGSLTFHPFVDHPYGTLSVGDQSLRIKEAAER